jgi:hypothetical protein
LKKQGLLQFGEWDEYLDEEGCITPIFEYPELKKEEFEFYLKQAYREYYLRPRFLFKALIKRMTNPELMKTSFKSGKNLLNYLKE